MKINEYVIDGHLGAGSFGTVVKARREVGQQPYREYAIKVLSQSRMKRFKKSMIGGDGKMVVKTGMHMVCMCCRCVCG